MGVWILVPISAVVATLWWRSHVRSRELRSLAASWGFHYLGDAFPRSILLEGSPFDSMTGVWNVLDGDPRGKRIIAFDCRFGVGKGSWRRTVIAVKTNMSDISASSFDPSSRIEQKGDWIIIYRPKEFALRQLTPISELRAYLDSL